MRLPTKFLALTILTILTNLGYASDRNTSSSDNQAQQKWYQVEVIIFTQNDVFGDELSSRDIMLAYPENLIDLNNNSAAYTRLAKDKLELGPDAYSLNRTGVYKVLYHQAWLQPGLAPANAPWIHINNNNGNTTLGGSLRIYLSSYLHMENNIWRVSYATHIQSPQPTRLNTRFRQTGSTSSPNDVGKSEDDAILLAATPPRPLLAPWPQPPTPPLHSTENIGKENSLFLATQRTIKEITLLKQESRLKLNKLHYFDHPKLGILAKVIRAQPPTRAPVERIRNVGPSSGEKSQNAKSSANANPEAP